MSSRHASSGRALKVNTTVEVCVETLVHKLSLINYRQGFLGSKYGKRRKPLDKTWFTSTPTERHAAEMFFTFFNLAAWMISEFSEIKVSPLKEGEDSAAAVKNLLQSMKQLNFRIPQTVTASRLQSGYGNEVCGVLHSLVDWVLESTLFQFQSPEHVTEEDDSNIDILEPDLEADMLSQTTCGPPKVLGATVDHDLTTLAPFADKAPSVSRPGTAHRGDGFIIENRIDRQLWDLEYQQVAPKLHIKVNAEARDWRAHLETVLRQLGQAFQSAGDPNSTTQQHGCSAENAGHASSEEIKRALTQLQGDVKEQLSKIDTREKFLNNEFATSTDVYRNKKELLQIKQDSYQEQTKEANESLIELQRCMHLIEEMQRELEERSSSSTTGVGPVVKIRTAMADLKADMKKIDVRLGITRHQLLHLQLQKYSQAGG